MTNKKHKFNNRDAFVPEEFKIGVDTAIHKFCQTDDQSEVQFPSSFTSEERKYIHQLAQQNGLKSKSRGKGSNRYITVYKQEGSTIVRQNATVQLPPGSKTTLTNCLKSFPFSPAERGELLPLHERERQTNLDGRDGASKTPLRLQSGVPVVPTHRVPCALSNAREGLPIWAQREDILKTINAHQIIMVLGETGSGKTTQVPQFILDQSTELGQTCRIICTQPRRISAQTMAARVAEERGEAVGQTVGYHIRLDSKVSHRSSLIYCSTGILLRTLMCGDANITTMTHIILDEVHERDRITDFLMTVLKDSVIKFRTLKLILMSATMETSKLKDYFPAAPVINIPGKLFEVKEQFLEDVLLMTKYMSPAMGKALKEYKKTQNRAQDLLSLSGKEHQRANKDFSLTSESVAKDKPSLGYEDQCVPDKLELTEDMITELDNCFYEAFQGNDEAFQRLLHYIDQEHITVDYQCVAGATVLMVAAKRGDIEVIEQLLSMGASVGISDGNGWNAIHWARFQENDSAQEVLEAHVNAINTRVSNAVELLNKEEAHRELTEEMKELLHIYHKSWDDERVDDELIIALLNFIHKSEQEGGVLVFLPGYEEITRIRDSIEQASDLFQENSYMLFMLHSCMPNADHKTLFRKAPKGKRKIILATNIAETAITIDDVVFVIDSGKVKEKSMDITTGASTLRSVWISKSSASQRKGRAGRTRPGICYKLYSRMRFLSMQAHQVPEILRVSLHELCLHVKLLAPPNTSIADFISKAPDPPSILAVRNAVSLLKAIYALDQNEEVTEVGHHILDLPVDPRLGKMILFAVILKCLDPVLTIVCCLAYRDPFILPTNPQDKRSATATRKKMSLGTFSDHMTYLKVFQQWQNAKVDGTERSFCKKNFLSAATMELIWGMRGQLLSLLRASGFCRPRPPLDVKELNTHSDKWAVVKAALTAGMYPNLIRVDREQMQLRSQKESKVRLHPSSTLLDSAKSVKPSAQHIDSLFQLPSDWMIYDEMSKTGRIAHARCVTSVTPITVALFSGPSRIPHESLNETDPYLRGAHASVVDSDSDEEVKVEGQNTLFKVDDWTVFHMNNDVAQILQQIRFKLHALFLKRMRQPGKACSPADETLLSSIVESLLETDKSVGLVQPSGVGQRPRMIGTPEHVMSAQASARRNSNDSELLEDGQFDAQGHFFSRSHRQPQQPQYKKQNNFAYQKKPVGVPSSGADMRSQRSSPSFGDLGLVDNTYRYFVVRVANPENLKASTSKSCWPFPPAMERNVSKALKEERTVFLFFMSSHTFDCLGYAQLTDLTPASPDASFCFPPNAGKLYRIHWLKNGILLNAKFRHLNIPYGDNRRGHQTQFFQEIDLKTGEALCLMWAQQSTSNSQQSFVNRPSSSFIPPHGGRPMRRFNNQPRVGMFAEGRGLSTLPSAAFNYPHHSYR